MDSLNTILDGKDFNEPDEVKRLKSYISSTYKVTPEIRIHPKGLTIVVDSSALASALRLNLPEIKRKLIITSQLNIRIR